MLDLKQVADLVQVVGPSGIWAVSAKEGLGVGPTTPGHRFDVGDGFAATRDGVPLAVVFDSVEEVSELAGRFGRRNFGHEIRLSDSSVERKHIGIATRPYLRCQPHLRVARRGTSDRCPIDTEQGRRHAYQRAA